jgi:hypothetical protein
VSRAVAIAVNPVRVGYWVGGLIVIVAAALTLEEGPGRSPVPMILFLAWGLLGLLGEVVAFFRSIEFVVEPRTLTHARPADGEVGVARMAGVVGEPNPIDPQFRRFVGEDPAREVAPLKDLDARRVPPLLGQVVWASVFLGRDGRSWSDEEIAWAHDSLRRAGVWIEREAMRWNAPVNIELADTYFVTDDHAPDDVEIMFQPEGETQGPIEARAVNKALVGMSRAAARLGFRDAVDLVSRINARLGADVTVWLIHPRRAGRSFAVPLENTELAGVSLAVCYAREASFPEPLTNPPRTDPVTIAHEFLHLFGATDKYGRPLSAFPPNSVTTRDIMRLSQTNLARLRIDPGTAAEIGWKVSS